ncbi:MAG TPA: SIMPL domain-containing protein [Casimicrobiaceae bacterium]|nr:SIMPL domain-containing protein [Casimicrobiaceae bacterium]
MKPFARLRTALRRALPLFALLAASAAAQVPAPPALPPSVTVTSVATTTVPNDRMQAWLRAEVEDASPAAAASQTNAIIARALAEAKLHPAVKVATAGYSTQQISEKGKPIRWRVTQSITLDSGDFTEAATLMSRLQDQGGMLLSGMGFSISDRARREAEDALTDQAIKGWQARARAAALGLGFGAWRVGHIVVQTSGGGPIYPQMRVQAMAMPAGAPVATEAGTTEVSVTVSGDAVLEQPGKP